MSATRPSKDLELENAELRERLAEAESLLQAIRHGEIDAVVVNGPHGERVFTLEGADRPYRILVETMNEGAATLTADGVVLYGNRRLAALLELSPARLVGARLASCLVPEDRARLESMMRTCGDECASGELTLLTSTGRTLPIHASFSSLRLDGMQLCCAIVTDVSLAKHHAALEAAAQQVREANDRLRRADQRKDEFLATLAHELRNPLAPIRAAASIAKSPYVTEAQLRWSHDVIERQVQHMALLLDDLLDVSRITQGKLEVRRETVELVAIIDTAVETARPLIDMRGHRLTVALPEQAVHLNADALRLAQVFANILTNAAKYTEPNGRIDLTASVDGSTVLVKVRDSGIGIAPEMLPRVFDMFSQATTALDRAEGGLGIGLALVKGLVDLHGGSIEVRSDGLGRGSEFIVSLPVAQAPRSHAMASDKKDQPDPLQQPRRIVVADDNRDAVASLKLLLDLDGHEVLAAHDGEQVLELAASARPEVILLDIGMPKMNGYEVAKRIRAQPWGREIKLIAVTGWGQVEDVERARAAGFDHHLTKPIEHDHVRLLLSRLPSPLARTSPHH